MHDLRGNFFIDGRRRRQKKRRKGEESHSTLPLLATLNCPLWLQYDCPFKVLVLGVNIILPF